MEVREWALIFFTVLGQTAVGAFIVLWVANLVAARQNAAEADRLTDRPFLMVPVLLIVGLVASFFHLGNIMNAPYAINNLGTSWMSREILLNVLFIVGVVVYIFLQLRKLGTSGLRNLIAAFTSVTGLALVYAMARIYMLESVPVWNHFGTSVSFFATAFMLGALAAGAALAVNSQQVRTSDPDCKDVQCQLLRQVLKKTSLVGVVSLSVLALVTALQYAYIAAVQAPGGELLYTTYSAAIALRLAFAIAGAGLLGLFVYQAASEPKGTDRLTRLAGSAFALVLVAEVIGRYVFYATYGRIGL